MLCVLIIGALFASIPLGKPHLKAAALIDLAVVALLFSFRVYPGTAHVADWILMGLFLLDGSIFFFTGEQVLI